MPLREEKDKMKAQNKKSFLRRMSMLQSELEAYYREQRAAQFRSGEPLRGIVWRRYAHVLIHILLTASRVFAGQELTIIGDKRTRSDRPLNAVDVAPDAGIVLPKEPVLWCANHAFKDDILATILASPRHTYLLLASLPHFYNTFDGITSWLNGVVMLNRKISISRHTAVPKAVRAMQFGADFLIFPEGGWNKSPNALILDLWPGIYRIACETGAKVVPVVHYIRDCATPGKSNPIHTVVDDPIRIDDISERAALEMIRDVLATWFYLMMEVYGKSTRGDTLARYNTPTEAWEQSLKARVETTGRYDVEIELCADYRPKWKIEPQQVWQAVANISGLTKDNMLGVMYARQMVERCKENDFQRRF